MGTRLIHWRWINLVCVIAGLLAVSLLFLLCASKEAHGQGGQAGIKDVLSDDCTTQEGPLIVPHEGMVLLTRNKDESLNTSPGYWNHAAILVHPQWVVESQEGKGVIKTPLDVFIQRDYEILTLYPRDLEVGKRAAKVAESFVGEPFGTMASLGPCWRFGRKNCVSVVERAYRTVTHDWPLIGVWKPDDILKPKVCSP